MQHSELQHATRATPAQRVNKIRYANAETHIRSTATASSGHAKRKTSAASNVNDVYIMSPVQVKCLFVIVALLALLLHAIGAATATDTQQQQRTDVSVEEEEEETAAAAVAGAGSVQLPADSTFEEAKDNSADDDVGQDEIIGRRLTDGYGLMADGAEIQQQQMVMQKHVKPLKNIFMGIYKNYKSTYLGNRTSVQYKQNLRERNGGVATPLPHASLKQEAKDTQIAEGDGDDDDDEHDAEEAYVADIDADDALPNATPTTIHHPVTTTTTTSTVPKQQQQQHNNKRNNEKKLPKRKQPKPTTNAATAHAAAANKQRKRNKTKAPTAAPPAGGDDALLAVEADEYTYSIGPGVNMSLDMSNDVVLVQLDGENLREIFRGHWLSDNTEQGRGKKYDMMSKVLPLFILPFLIQSAIVPFLVTKLKLLLMKSILVGKLAIFLLIISALRNGNKMQSYEVAPSYWASEPSRRSELAAAASSMGYGPGSYRVEGKPAWIN